MIYMRFRNRGNLFFFLDRWGYSSTSPLHPTRCKWTRTRTHTRISKIMMYCMLSKIRGIWSSKKTPSLNEKITITNLFVVLLFKLNTSTITS
jgi:hypothetical protein